MIEFIKELTRRKVWLFGGLYMALGWVMLQVAIAVEATMNLPNWIDQSVLVLLIVGFPFALLLAWAQESQGKSHAEEGKAAKVATAAPASTDLPVHSFAALPFDNLSDDPRLGFIGDGLSEDIITHMTADGLFKIAARNASFQYKEGTRDLPAIGKELGVRFILEGSLRLVGDQVRVNAQLIDVATTAHVWATQDDSPLEDFLADQDRTVMDYSATIVGVIRSVGSNELTPDDPEALATVDLLNLAAGPAVAFSRPALASAEKLLRWLLEREPDNASAHAQLADNLAKKNRINGDAPQLVHEELAEHIRRAVSGGPGDSGILGNCGSALIEAGKLDEGLTYVRRAVRLAPWSFPAASAAAKIKIVQGHFEEVLMEYEAARELVAETSVHYAFVDMYRAHCLVGLGRFAEAEVAAKETVSHRPDFRSLTMLVVALAHQDKIEEARQAARRLTDQMPFPDVAILRADVVRSNLSNEFVKMVLEGFDKAGLLAPEEERPNG